MSKWKIGADFGEGNFDAVAMIHSTFGNLEVLARKGSNIYHFWRESKAPFKWHNNGIIAKDAHGAHSFIQSRYGKVGNFEAILPNKIGGGLRHIYRENTGQIPIPIRIPKHEWNGTMLRFENPDGSWGQFVDLKGDRGEKGPKGDKGDQGDPGDPNPGPPRLRVMGGGLFYGNKRVKLPGVGRWEAWWRDLEIPGQGTWGKKSYNWYVDQIVKYKLPYVRHGSVKDPLYVRDKCIELKERGLAAFGLPIFVELTLSNGDLPYLGDPEKMVDKTLDIGTVFYDSHNEFLDKKAWYDRAVEITDMVLSKGGIVGGGAWGHSSQGKEWSQKYINEYGKSSYITSHRPWTKKQIEDLVKLGKPVVFNEYFDRGDLGLSETEAIMRRAFEAGAAAVQYYGVRCPDCTQDIPNCDPAPFWKYFEMAGKFLN